MFEKILLDIDEKVARLTLNRPDKLNAVDNQTVDELDEALSRIEADSSLRVLILTGAGEKAFVAGADIGELARRDMVNGRSDTRRRQEVYARIEKLEIPSIAAVNGYALGTGLELAMTCTFRIASTRARFGQPEVKLGIIPGAGGTQRLPRLVGMARAMELVLTGDPIKPDAALAMGLVNRVVEPEALSDAVDELAEKLVQRPKLALQYAKEAVSRASEGSLEEGLAHESYLHALSCASADKKEGVAAFLEKRPPVFVGK